MFDSIGRFGASLVYAGGVLCLFFGAIFIAAKIVERFVRDDGSRASDRKAFAIGLALFMASFGILSVLFYPALHAVESYSCGGRPAYDYHACMGDDD